MRKQNQEMKWTGIKALSREQNLEDFERYTGYHLPEDFKAHIRAHNGGLPSSRMFNTKGQKGLVWMGSLSFNHSDRPSVWDVYDKEKLELGDQFLVFGTDETGSLLCFDTDTDCIVFLDQQDLCVEPVADTFTEFLDGLYEL